MGYFAEIDENGIVKRVIVAEQDFIDSGVVGDPKNWVETDLDGIIRKNPAVKGGTYDSANDAFIPKKPFDSWSLDSNFKWKPPKDVPEDGTAYAWDESKQDWIKTDKAKDK